MRKAANDYVAGFLVVKQDVIILGEDGIVSGWKSFFGTLASCHRSIRVDVGHHRATSILTVKEHPAIGVHDGGPSPVESAGVRFQQFKIYLSDLTVNAA